MGMWLLTTKCDEDGLWPHGIYDNLETLEAELRRLDSRGIERTVFHMPEINTVGQLGPIDMFEESLNNVDWFIAWVRDFS